MAQRKGCDIVVCIDYIRSRFEATGSHISKELAGKICQRADNHSSYVQQLAWLVEIHTDKVATEWNSEEIEQEQRYLDKRFS